MKNRSVVAVILLSLFTCGIYSIYWLYVTAEDFNHESDKEPLMNYIVAILLGLVTCGIYLLYWEYKFYKRADEVTDSNNLILNFILALFITPMVSNAIVQNQINDYLYANGDK